MKKILLSSLLVLGFVSFSSSASADVCGDNFRAEMVTDPVTLVVSTVQVFDHFRSCEGGDPMKVNQAWGLDGYHTPMVKTGVIITDEAGLTDTCPTWYPVMGCFDLSKTDYYKAQMRIIAKQIQVGGFNFSQNFAYWLTH